MCLHLRVYPQVNFTIGKKFFGDKTCLVHFAQGAVAKQVVSCLNIHGFEVVCGCVERGFEEWGGKGARLLVWRKKMVKYATSAPPSGGWGVINLPYPPFAPGCFAGCLHLSHPRK